MAAPNLVPRLFSRLHQPHFGADNRRRQAIAFKVKHCTGSICFVSAAKLPIVHETPALMIFRPLRRDRERFPVLRITLVSRPPSPSPRAWPAQYEAQSEIMPIAPHYFGACLLQFCLYGSAVPVAKTKSPGWAGRFASSSGPGTEPISRSPASCVARHCARRTALGSPAPKPSTAGRAWKPGTPVQAARR
jgi:hypothetical protein